MKNSEKVLYLILKTAERCNLNCKYCYFFNGGDQSYKKHPAFISSNVVSQLVCFLKQGIQDLGINKLNIAFHGGEPTLQPISQFESCCSQLKSELAPLVDLDWQIQTNGTLITKRWIDVLSRNNVSVGISLDGPQEYNDIDRVDHSNQGTYHLTRKGIDCLKQAALQGKINDIGALCVINPKRDARIIYRHFVDELHFTKMDFLLPDFTHDNFEDESIDSYANYLCTLFSEWIKDNNPNIKIRFFESIFNVMVGKNTTLISVGPDLENTYALTVSSNGEISPDDTLRSANCGNLMQLTNIWNSSLRDFFDKPILQNLKNCRTQLPKKCQKCCWQKVCQGGFYIHRYSQKNGFDNPSLMCSALKKIYSKAAVFLLDNGYSFSELKDNLLVR